MGENQTTISIEQFNALIKQMEELKIQNQNLTKNLINLQQVENQTLEQKSLPSPQQTKELLKKPEPYSGKREEYDEFAFKMRTYYKVNSSIYNTAYLQIQLLGSLLSGDAAKWFTNKFLDNTFNDATTWTVFENHFKEKFQDTNPHETALLKLYKLKQTGSCTKYCDQFDAIICKTALNDCGKIDLFKKGLKLSILESMRTIRETPTSLKDFQKLCIDLDNKNFEFENFKKNNYNFPSKTIPNPKYFNQSNINSDQSQDTTTPMELDQISSHNSKQNPTQFFSTTNKTTLTQEEKDRRKEQKLCRYCGENNCGGTPDTSKCFKLQKKNNPNFQRSH